MNLSERGADAIKGYEDCVLTAYPDPGTGDAPWTIGCGHTGNVHEGDTCTQAQADDWFKLDSSDVVRAVAGMVSVPVTQGQFDALVSFAYNLGASALRGSTLLRLLNVSQYAAAAQEFSKWNHANGKVLSGLTKRRAAEQAMFEGRD